MSEQRPLIREVRWPATGLLAAFVIVGVLTHTSRNIGMAVVGALVAILAGSLVAAGYGPRTALALALIAGVGVALDAGSRGGSLAWFGLCVLAFVSIIAAGSRLGSVFAAAALVLLTLRLFFPTVDVGWLPWIAGVLVSACAAALIARERALAAALRAAQAGLAERSRAEERNRIARDLHDVIAHSLTVSLLHVSSARLAVEHDPADAARALAEAERLGRESLQEVRSIVGMLRTDEDRGSTAPVAGVDEIPELVERFRGAGADVSLDRVGRLERLSATAGATLYRILQEALTNTVKHAPGSRVAVRLLAANGEAELTIDSTGPARAGTGLGLATMRERAQAVGGRCEAGPVASGWRVRASVPIPKRR